MVNKTGNTYIGDELQNYIEIVAQRLKQSGKCLGTVDCAIRTLAGLPHTANCPSSKKGFRRVKYYKDNRVADIEQKVWKRVGVFLGIKQEEGDEEFQPLVLKKV